MTQDQKNSLFELQKIDTNCSDCIFMKRDLDKLEYWKGIKKENALKEFNKEKDEAVKVAKAMPNPSSVEAMLNKASKMTFQFRDDFAINYGHCNKLNKEVSFLPNTCNPENSSCFEHRRKV